MMRRPVFLFGAIAAVWSVGHAPLWADQQDDLAELKQLIKQQQAGLEKQQVLIQRLTDKVAVLEATRQDQTRGNVDRPEPDRPLKRQASAPEQPVNLSYEEVPLTPQAAVGAPTSVAFKDWYKRIQVSGFGAGGFVWTGQDAERPNSAFLNYQALLTVNAEIWESVSFMAELEAIRIGDENDASVDTRQVYIHLTPHLKGYDAPFGIKVGRFFIPFGEEHRWQDANTNSLITNSAPWPTGVDEGILFHGRVKGVTWEAALMDGTFERGVDDDLDKAVALRFSGNPFKRLRLGASFLRTGTTGSSAFKFGGGTLQAVGRGGGTSSRGISPSIKVDSYLYEFGARYALSKNGYVDAAFGQAFVNDPSPNFDRAISYFYVEPLYHLTSRLYVVSRFSGIGTFDDAKGYRFNGAPFAGGTSDFGFDTKSLLRWAIGLGYRPNPRTLVKLEYSMDDFQVIKSSTLDDTDEDRQLLGALMVVEF